MSTDNCPHCGSAQSDAPNQRHISWDCKTWRGLDGCVIRSCVCIERENGNLRAENAELRDLLGHIYNSLDDIRTYWNQDRNDDAMFNSLWYIIGECDHTMGWFDAIKPPLEPEKESEARDDT